MKKIKIGIIGTGVGIRTYLNGFRLLEDAEVIAICGSSLSRSKEFASKHNIPIPSVDYRELCDIPELDLVCITSPNRFHYDATKYAVLKNKHIICEKPLSDRVEEIDALIDCTVDYTKIAVVDHQLRFNPYIKKIRELIVSGELGIIHSVKLNQQGTGFANTNAEWSWSFDENAGGGVRLAMASHFTDLIQYWFGNLEVINVSGFLNPVTKERKDNNGNIRTISTSTICNASITFENELNVIYSINAGSYMGSRFDISIFGTKGEVYFSLQDKLVLYTRTKIGERQTILVDGVFPDEAENKVSIFSGSFKYFAPIVIQSIQKNDFMQLANAASFKDAKYNVNILEAIKHSANNNNVICVAKVANRYV